MKASGKFSEQELASMLRNGSESAFNVIYKRYWHKLLAIAGRRLNDIQDAEEAVQNVFLNLWKRRENFVLTVSFENYFAVAIKFEVINKLAKVAREAARNREFAREVPENHEIIFTYDLALLRKQLEETIDGLPYKCQLVFRMSREGNYTNKKLAQEFNVSEKTIEKHITTALKALRKRFGRHSLVLFLFF